MGAFTVYPSENDVAVVADDGRVGQEITHKEYAQTWVADYFVSGFTLPASTSGTLNIDVATGEAVLGGQRIQMGSIETILLVANNTNHIFLQLTFDGNSKVDGVQIVSNTTGAVPSDSVKIGEAVTDATEVTSTTDLRPLGHNKDALTFGRALNIHLGTGVQSATKVLSAGSADITGATITVTREQMQGADTKVLIIATGDVDAKASGPTGAFIEIKIGGVVARVIATTVSGEVPLAIHHVATLDQAGDRIIKLSGGTVTGSWTVNQWVIDVFAIGKG